MTTLQSQRHYQIARVLEEYGIGPTSPDRPPRRGAKALEDIDRERLASAIVQALELPTREARYCIWCLKKCTKADFVPAIAEHLHDECAGPWLSTQKDR